MHDVGIPYHLGMSDYISGLKNRITALQWALFCNIFFCSFSLMKKNPARPFDAVIRAR
jgi:hypothetical protein